jgi:hypothetical protein
MLASYDDVPVEFKAFAVCLERNRTPLSNGKWNKLYAMLKCITRLVHMHVTGYICEDGYIYYPYNRRQCYE